MAGLIEDYAVIGNCETMALVCRDGSRSTGCACLPRFDSAACFAALLGDEQHGRWQICPADSALKVTRRYPRWHADIGNHIRDHDRRGDAD